ncbi:LamG-like jellyroll fold domain-containing protein [Aquirufa lenticrescens]
MKKLLTLFFFLSALNSNAQQSNFRGHNNYVVPPLPSEILKTGLVMNLDAGDPLSYSGSGNMWTDLTGNGNNGTILSPNSYNAVNGGYLQLSVGNGISLPATSTDFNFTSGDFAIEIWAKPIAAYQTLISLNTLSSGWSALRLESGQSDGQISLLQSSAFTSWDVNFQNSQVDFTRNNWHQILLSRVSNNLIIYVDGVSKITVASAPSLKSNTPGSSLNTIGSMTSGSSYGSYSGIIAIVRVYKGNGLTANQALENYKAVKSRFGL